MHRHKVAQTASRAHPLPAGAERMADALLGPAYESSSAAASGPPQARRRGLFSDPKFICFMLAIADACAVVGASSFMLHAYVSGRATDLAPYVVISGLQLGLTMLSLLWFGSYSVSFITSWPKRFGQMVYVFAALTLILITVAFAAKLTDQLSRVWFFSSQTLILAFLICSRSVAKGVMKSLARKGVLQRNVAIVGATAQAGKLIARYAAEEAFAPTVVGVFDDRATRVHDSVAGIPVLGDLEQLTDMVRRGIVHHVVIALPWSADARIASLVANLQALPVHISLSDDLVTHRLPAIRKADSSTWGTVEITAPPFDGVRGIIKVLEDRILGTIALLCALPLMLVVAALIRIDSPGPVIFRQKRYGFNNEEIIVYKFRTMRPADGVHAAFRQAQRNDPRVTRIGRLLRRSSLDELPQLWNVLQGTMSLVGPRPHVAELNMTFAKTIENYEARHKVKPGITGWAQVNGLRGETTLESMQSRVAFDVWYIENWSLWLDIRILFQTVFGVWLSKNAY